MCRRKRSGAVHVAFCTDGDPGQFLGIAIVIWKLGPEILRSFDGCFVWLTAPPEAHESARQILGSVVPRERLRLLSAQARPQDRYYVQISLAKVFSVVDPQDQLLCIDYDHLVMRPLGSFIDCRPPFVMLSSETRPDGIGNLDAALKFSPNPIMGRINTSFIWGDAISLSEIGDRWTDSYFELEPYVDKRNLVEYAFGLAAMRAGKIVQPCDSSVQGNFAVPNADCKLFHYGGDSATALAMKRMLYESAVENSGGDNWRRIIRLAELALKRRVESHLLQIGRSDRKRTYQSRGRKAEQERPADLHKHASR